MSSTSEPSGERAEEARGVRVARARRGLAVYLGATVVLSGVVIQRLLASGAPIASQPWLVFALMWSPGVASLVTRAVLREGFADVSFRLPARGWRSELLLAWLWPLGVGCIAYGLAWATKLETFAARNHLFGASMSTPVAFALSIAVSLTIATVFGAVFALGEELGWRGYMLTRLIDAGVPGQCWCPR
ncbi:MAG: hypothetical protein U0263_40240 [Polyangiaceae bacterium]